MVREVLNITKDSVTVNNESLVVFSSTLLLKTSLTTLSAPAQFQGYLGSVPDLFLWKRNILFSLHFPFAKEPVWYFSPPKRRTAKKKKKSFLCQQEVLYYSIDQWPFTYRYHVDRYLQVKNLFTKTCLPRIFGTNKWILFLFYLGMFHFIT